MKRKSKKSGVAKGYLHGFTSEEQDRLYHQARFLEPYVHGPIHFPSGSKVIEVGCGVGAQTEILLRRSPDIQIFGLDASSTQIARAKKHLTKAIKSKRVEFQVGDALHIPVPDNSFDGAFICWLLEHVAEPVGILKEVRRTLKDGGIIHCTEVQNASFFVHPYSPATLQYWFDFNDHQWTMKGDPFIGAKLGNYLQKAGFQDIQTKLINHHYDNRTPKTRALFIEYWTSLLLSGAPGLLKAKKVTQKHIDQMKKELKALRDDPDAVFMYSWVHATAVAR